MSFKAPERRFVIYTRMPTKAEVVDLTSDLGDELPLPRVTQTPSFQRKRKQPECINLDELQRASSSSSQELLALPAGRKRSKSEYRRSGSISSTITPANAMHSSSGMTSHSSDAGRAPNLMSRLERADFADDDLPVPDLIQKIEESEKSSHGPRRRISTTFRPTALGRKDGHPSQFQNIGETCFRGMTIKASDKVGVQLKDDSFLRVTAVLQLRVTPQKKYLCGQRLVSSTSLNAMIEVRDDEVCWFKPMIEEQAIEKDDEHAFFNGSHYVPLTDIVDFWKIIMSNLPIHDLQGRLRQHRQTSRTVYCRYVVTKVYATVKHHKEGRESELIVARLRQEDADPAFSDEDERIRYAFRGETMKGGSCFGIREDEYEHQEREFRRATLANQLQGPAANHDGIYFGEITPHYEIPGTSAACPVDLADNALDKDPIVIDDDSLGDEIIALDEDVEASPGPTTSTLQDNIVIDSSWLASLATAKVTRVLLKEPGPQLLQRYTFADAFCGAGGTSRGAKMAGLKIEWAVDSDPAAIKSYRASFPSTLIALAEVFAFVTGGAYGKIVDILHLSPPCQFYSPLHVIHDKRRSAAGIERDEANTASSFMIEQMIQRFRPRVITLENSGGLWSMHKDYLYAIIRQFTSCGYSIRLKVHRMSSFGVPQVRKRLLIIASCPGELLPTFPTATHEKIPAKPDVRGYNYVNNAIKGTIPEHWHDHDVAATKKSNRYTPYNGNVAQAKVITCSGGEDNWHPSEKRQYTKREIAALQTFPIEHDFCRTLSRSRYIKQVGNAVPPLAAKVLFVHIKEWLQRVDGIFERR